MIENDIDDFNLDDLLDETDVSGDELVQNDLSDIPLDESMSLDIDFNDETSEIVTEDVVLEDVNDLESQDEAIFDEDFLDADVLNDSKAIEASDNEDCNGDCLSEEFVDVIDAEDVSDEIAEEKADDGKFNVDQSVDDVELPEGFFEDDAISENSQEEFFREEVNDDIHSEYFNSQYEEVDIPSSIENKENSSNIGVLLSQNIGQLKWYSGNSGDKMFEISKGFESGTFDADEECKIIHVDVGYDTYGWEVQFSDGLVMNLRDVREYQIRNGRLPSSEGRIIFAQSTLNFSGVEKIVIYENVKYFSYGI